MIKIFAGIYSAFASIALLVIALLDIVTTGYVNLEARPVAGHMTTLDAFGMVLWFITTIYCSAFVLVRKLNDD